MDTKLGVSEPISKSVSQSEGDNYQLESRELKKGRFSVISAIGIQYSISATPLAVGGYLTFILGVGGSPFFFYCFIVAIIGQLLLATSLAEIAAVYPHASGQVLWTAALSPPRWARFLSYWNGASTTLGWIFANAGSYIFTAQLMVAAAEVRNPGFVAQPYHVFLINCACGLGGVMLNTVLFKRYPKVTNFMVWFINGSTVYILICLLVRAHPKASAHTVFVQVINETGWSSNALVFFLGFLPGCVAVTCFDTAAHMAEEMDEPERQVPQVMVGASALCAGTGLIMILVYLFCTVAPMNLLDPVGGQPVFQVFKDAFQSPAMLLVALIIYCIVYFSSCPACIATSSRLLWSFAKHGGLPSGNFIGHVQGSTQVPVNAVYITATASSLVGLLVFGPTTVLNGVFGAGGVCFFFSYGMPIWLLVFRNKRKDLPKRRYFSLGKFGLPVNILTIMWQLISIPFICFPLYNPVTPTTMNWASVCGVVALCLAGINWFAYAKKHYRPPHSLFVAGIHGSGGTDGIREE